MRNPLTDLSVHFFRNIKSAKISLHPSVNYIYGANGSGKTSLLEAIYLLSSGHSFRTRETAPLIQHGESSLTVFARTSLDESISIQKSLSGPTLVQLNQRVCFSRSDLARYLPCQLIHQNIFQIIDAGPSLRRSILDWGLFHVEQSYHAIWKNYRYVLMQRNALLRQKALKSLFVPWDSQLNDLSEQLHAYRIKYFLELSKKFQLFQELLTNSHCIMKYFKGWDKRESGRNLFSILEDQFLIDRQRQYTSMGAHQADIVFQVDKKNGKFIFSRGQQKIILIALKLAQASLVTGGCLYLLDDLVAELDEEHLQRVMSCVQMLSGQIILTGIDENFLKKVSFVKEHRVFAVELGKINMQHST